MIVLRQARNAAPVDNNNYSSFSRVILCDSLCHTALRADRMDSLSFDFVFIVRQHHTFSQSNLFVKHTEVG